MGITYRLQTNRRLWLQKLPLKERNQHILEKKISAADMKCRPHLSVCVLLLFLIYDERCEINRFQGRRPQGPICWTQRSESLSREIRNVIRSLISPT